MKKIFAVLAATLLCGASLLTSCSKDKEDNTDLNLSEKIIGRWISADGDGQPVATNEKVVLNFVSTTKAYMSGSFNHRPDAGSAWVDKVEHDVAIDGNKVTVTCHYDEHSSTEEIFTVTAISASEFSASLKFTLTVDGNAVFSREYPVRYVKVDADYSASIIGKWQGHCTSEGSVFDDGQEHQWEYCADGNFLYYRQVDGQWQLNNDEYANYFVAGNLLCARWKNAGEGQEEHREWWEISIDGNQMHWTALRQNPDGTTYTATFEMSKVGD